MTYLSMCVLRESGYFIYFIVKRIISVFMDKTMLHTYRFDVDVQNNRSALHLKVKFKIKKNRKQNIKFF